MRPVVYLEQLEEAGEREHLAPSDLRPISSTDLQDIENEVGMPLPVAYTDFLCDVGPGTEHGGLARWHHIDITRTGNVLDVSHRLMSEQIKAMRAAGVAPTGYPQGMLVIYDACDGEVFGFLPNSAFDAYQEAVFSWDCDDFTLTQVADSFCEFLDYLREIDIESAELDSADFGSVEELIGDLS